MSHSSTIFDYGMSRKSNHSLYALQSIEIADPHRPVWKETITWLLFWPLLTLIARQAVYFTGPARDAASYQVGSVHESHLYTYVNFLFLLGFTLVGMKQIWSVLTKHKALLALLCLAFISVLWSTAKQTTLQVSLSVGVCSLFACYLSSRFSTQWLMRLLIFMGIASALLSILFAVALPSYGVFVGYAGGAWQGITPHKNTLGLSMAFLLTPIFFVDRISLNRRILYSVLLLFVLYKSQSRGAWLDTAAMFSFVGFLYLVRRLRFPDLMLLLIATTVIVIGIAVVGIVFLEPITFALGKDPTLDGRTVIYQLVWQAIMKRPWLGYGLDSFWFPGSNESQFISLSLKWPGIGYSENGFLELLLQLGFVSLILLLFMMGKALLQGVRMLDSYRYTPRVGWFLTILFLVLVTNIDAGWFLTDTTLDWVLVIVSCVGLNEEWNRVRSSELLSRFLSKV